MAKDATSLTATLSALSGDSPPSREAAVLLAILQARDSSCPVWVGQVSLLIFMLVGVLPKKNICGQ